MPSDENIIAESTRAQTEANLAQLRAQLQWNDEMAEKYLEHQTKQISKLNRFRQCIARLESTIAGLRKVVAQKEREAALLETKLRVLKKLQGRDSRDGRCHGSWPGVDDVWRDAGLTAGGGSADGQPCVGRDCKSTGRLAGGRGNRAQLD